ncbi:hypothetical protein PEBR_41929 [Penicillium brasilianum]|uniref:DUF3669 domain-containing protein n=1 Tax=Penicillium brasilianum TaxID=104259 RepID=A0A1S9RAU3_PENBI|nr:hypothetical protein PEBR_41929 [Penicillium brasilianum]
MNQRHHEAEYLDEVEPIGAGSSGTVWAPRGGEPAFKQEHRGREGSLENDFKMHKQVIRTLHILRKMKALNFEDDQSPQVQISECHRFIRPTDDEWWKANLKMFPNGLLPCNLIRSERIFPFADATKYLLVKNYCSPGITEFHMMTNKQDKDCLIRPYLGSRSQRPSVNPHEYRFTLRNFPLHQDQMEEIGIPMADMKAYAAIMGETLAAMHWIGEVDGRDIEFVLAPAECKEFKETDIITNVLGEHCMWVLDFDLCQDITMDIQGVHQAVNAYWWSEPLFMPRPESNSPLWKVFRDQYLKTS